MLPNHKQQEVFSQKEWKRKAEAAENAALALLNEERQAAESLKKGKAKAAKKRAKKNAK